MSKTKKQILLIIILICILILIILLWSKKGETPISEFKGNSETLEVSATKLEVTYDASDENTSWDEASTSYVELNDAGSTVNGEGVAVQNNIITINKGGTYYIRGQLSNGSLVVDASKDEEVHLILAGVSISSSDSSAIYGKKAKKIIITLEENSINSISDGSTRTNTEDDEELDGAIYSKCDLSINGSGNLSLKSNYQDGIVSKDGLKIISGNIQVQANDDGIRGKDYVAIKGGEILVKAIADGIKSNNDTDESLGYICIEGGNIQIESDEDGMQAETVMQIADANINITTAGGSANSTNSTNSTNISQQKGNFKTAKMQPSAQTQVQETTEDEKSQKAIKAGKEINIKSGNINIDSIDDALHSNGSIVISGGTFKIQAGDDAIHADEKIKIENGEITIDSCYEGIEASYIQIDNGKIALNASDDGINISSSTEETSEVGAFGPNAQANLDTNLKLIINGGEIQVDAQGDGLDANGSMYINGGYIMVNGPTSSGNGSLDYDGECVITGGTLIAVGAAGMLQTPSSNSTQYTVAVMVNGTAGKEVSLTNSNGKELLKFTPSKKYQSIIISSKDLKKGSEYKLKTSDADLSNFTISNIVTSSGNMNTQKHMF